ncbi:hypothetical protein ACFZCK_14230 [Kitasatospora purpeofusca]|uniref:hypothetical protein n=1 Tax=Kitasatospora purpeofusca TaxID=67352 RepID=UPI0036E4638C
MQGQSFDLSVILTDDDVKAVAKYLGYTNSEYWNPDKSVDVVREHIHRLIESEMSALLARSAPYRPLSASVTVTAPSTPAS